MNDGAPGSTKTEIPPGYLLLCDCVSVDDLQWYHSSVPFIAHHNILYGHVSPSNYYELPQSFT